MWRSQRSSRDKARTWQGRRSGSGSGGRRRESERDRFRFQSFIYKKSESRRFIHHCQILTRRSRSTISARGWPRTRRRSGRRWRRSGMRRWRSGIWKWRSGRRWWRSGRRSRRTGCGRSRLGKGHSRDLALVLIVALFFLSHDVAETVPRLGVDSALKWQGGNRNQKRFLCYACYQLK